MSITKSTSGPEGIAGSPGDDVGAQLEGRVRSLVRSFGSVVVARSRIVAELKDIGYRYVTLDLEGFRSGSMNEVLEGEWR